MDRVVDALEEVWSSMRALLGGLESSEWARPTPCSEWDVRELAAHLAAGQGYFEGFPQPPLPAGWKSRHEDLIGAATDAHVVAPAGWSPERILDELARATDAQVRRFRGLDAEGWEAPSEGPPGVRTVAQLARNRLLDGYIHLLDLRVALGRSLDMESEPIALRECVAQAVEFSGWGAVKRAGLEDGSRIGLRLADPFGCERDLVVEGGRGRLVDPSGRTEGSIEGTAPAYLLVATGRAQWTDDAGGISAHGSVAKRFLDGYVIWA